MAFEIRKYDDKITRIHGDKGNLVGLITKQDNKFRVEMFMKVDYSCFSHEAAVMFARGVEATMRAYKLLPKQDEQKETN